MLKKLKFDPPNDQNNFITPFKPSALRLSNTEAVKQEGYQIKTFTDVKVKQEEVHKTNKGLKFLSSKVKEIVIREQCTSYK